MKNLFALLAWILAPNFSYGMQISLKDFTAFQIKENNIEKSPRAITGENGSYKILAFSPSQCPNCSQTERYLEKIYQKDINGKSVKNRLNIIRVYINTNRTQALQESQNWKLYGSTKYLFNKGPIEISNNGMTLILFNSKDKLDTIYEDITNDKLSYLRSRLIFFIRELEE